MYNVGMAWKLLGILGIYLLSLFETVPPRGVPLFLLPGLPLLFHRRSQMKEELQFVSMCQIYQLRIIQIYLTLKIKASGKLTLEPREKSTVS